MRNSFRPRAVSTNILYRPAPRTINKAPKQEIDSIVSCWGFYRLCSLSHTNKYELSSWCVSEASSPTSTLLQVRNEVLSIDWQNLTLVRPEFTASLSSLGKICWVRLEDEVIRFTIIPDQGTQVWAQLPVVGEFYSLLSLLLSILCCSFSRISSGARRLLPCAFTLFAPIVQFSRHLRRLTWRVEQL